ncbi:hypothetical protein ABBQ32_014003 [Trebouxia sp. C0010 RCD-2024]
MAVAKVGGDEGFWKFSDAMFEYQEDFFDIAINNMTRPQVCAQLAKLAAQSANVSKDAVLQQLAFPEGDPHPGSIISKVSRMSIWDSRAYS